MPCIAPFALDGRICQFPPNFVRLLRMACISRAAGRLRAYIGCMKVAIFTRSIAVFLLLNLSFAPAFADSPLIKGRVQHNSAGTGSDSQAESKPKPNDSQSSEIAPSPGAASAPKPDSDALFGVIDEGPQALDAQISKELKDKTFQLQNSQSSAQLGTQQQAPLQAKANGGEEVYGCLGALLNMMNGAILKIFPQSDLNNLEVLPGDRIVGVNGHRYDFRTIIQEMVGTPGTIIELDIQTPERVVKHLQVRRTDARLLPQMGMYKQLTKRNRFW